MRLVILKRPSFQSRKYVTPSYCITRQQDPAELSNDLFILIRVTNDAVFLKICVSDFHQGK